MFRFSKLLLTASLLTIAFGILFQTAPAQAQSGCVPFHAIAQATLPTSTPLAATDTWGGTLYGMLGDELLLGVLSGNDGNETFRRHMGTGRAGSYTVCVGYPACTDSFTYQVPNAVFTFSPHIPGTGNYYGNTANIVGGAGRFQSASGNLNVIGPAITWPDPKSPIGVSGRWNVEISGNICGIQ